VPNGPQGMDPEDPFFRFFFGPGNGGQGRQPREQGLGSGVVVGDGIIVTNNHVVEHADEVKVATLDRHEFIAEVVGTDPKSDVAVLRVKDEKKLLRPLALGDSDRLRLGDVVLAVGNPFGVGQTVTMGIVSAKGRSDLGIVDYEDFIQTDAAINPGNSGGALVDMEGALVGINTAILSRSGGNMGIGFAIPTKMVRPIVDSLLTEGKVVRGWLGVTIQNLNDELAQALTIPAGGGVVVSDVSKDSPAAKAGMLANDVIVAVDGKAIATVGELRNTIAASGANRTVKITVKRGTKTVVLDVALSAIPEKFAGEPNAPAGEGASNEQTAALGVKLAPLTAELRDQLDVPKETASGVVIAQVASGSPAERAGLRRGDVVVELGRRPVGSPEEFLRIWKDSKSPVAALVLRGGNKTYLVLKRD
jgi:serine protease Do